MSNMAVRYSESEGRFVSGGGGVQLFARAWGPNEGSPILFLHSWSGSHAIWEPQYESALAERFRLVAMDVRGSGYSEKPADASAYTAGAATAEDLAAVVGAFDLDRPVLVGASIGGILIADYLSHYGDSNVAGAVLVGSLFAVGGESARELMGPAAALVTDTLSFDFAAQLKGVQGFLSASGGTALNDEELQRQVVISMMTPPHVRAALLQRESDHSDTWRRFAGPALIVHGDDDQVVPMATGQRFAELLSQVEVAPVQGAGHIVAREEPAQFNDLLAAFVHRVRDG